ncbi:MAG: glucuronate isomerase [Lachnospiraceae bacterium]|jgi:glucuronate isomerase|nr:glucuronate isomerase [Lachnospiraceae bacterium]
MKKFMEQDFLLSTKTAADLYERIASKAPILDYHCHLSPKEIAEDRRFENIAQLWLEGDHYKWRLMRANGIEERYITGNASDCDKFQEWARTLPRAIGNPLYHWSHLELRRYFDYHGVLKRQTAAEVWEHCQERIAGGGFTARELIQRSGVTLLCTTDDPADSLPWHRQIAEDKGFSVQVLPTFRPDRAMNLEKHDYLEYLHQLGEASGIEINSFSRLLEALAKRMDWFSQLGCRLSDHAPDYVMCRPGTINEVEQVLAKRLAGQPVSADEVAVFKTAFMQFMAWEYQKRNWTMQIHYGCKRDNNAYEARRLGSNTGFDCINNYAPSTEVSDFLDSLASADRLPKTIIYSLNPNDDAIIQTIIGCFQDGQTVGKIQHGSAWWFNDHLDGMRAQMKSLAAQGLLGNFIGMLTDSRSFLSYTRHEYFRRILCDMVGTWVESGEYPDDGAALEKMIKGVCYNNAVLYFGFDLELV